VKADDEMLHAAKTAFELERNAGAWFLSALRAAIDAAIVDVPDVAELLSIRARLANVRDIALAWSDTPGHAQAISEQLLAVLDAAEKNVDVSR
jgi:hypothetical protein